MNKFLPILLLLLSSCSLFEERYICLYKYKDLNNKDWAKFTLIIKDDVMIINNGYTEHSYNIIQQNADIIIAQKYNIGGDGNPRLEKHKFYKDLKLLDSIDEEYGLVARNQCS